MYSKHETPLVKASIFYYDSEYKNSVSESIFCVLEKYKMHSPERIYAGKLTRHKYILAGTSIKELFVRAYSEKDVLEVDMSSSNSACGMEYWNVNLGLTFLKSSRLVVQPQIMPWNILSIQSTHGRLRNPLIYEEFMACVKELIDVVNPFYISIDDVDNKVCLMNQVHAERFEPSRIQQIYWGNYLGKMHCEMYGQEKLKKIPAKHIEWVNGGVFFCLTDHVLDYNSKECKSVRTQVFRYLKHQ